MVRKKIKKPEIKFLRKVVKLKDIKIDKNNPNRMSDIKKAGLRKSINLFGYVNEICIESDTMLLADGEHRLKELMDAGHEKAEVKIFKFKDEAERRLFRQTFNKLKGEHDLEADKEEFKFLDEHDRLSDLAEMLGEDEIDFVYEEENLPPDLEKTELEVKMSREVTCPKCKHQFEIDKKGKK